MVATPMLVWVTVLWLVSVTVNREVDASVEPKWLKRRKGIQLRRPFIVKRKNE